MIDKNKINSIVPGSYLFITNSQEIKQEVVDYILNKFEIDRNNYIEVTNTIDSIKIDTIREIKKKIFLKSSSKYNLLAIYNAQNMTREAANALLKILEEPPKFFIMMLFSDNIGKLIPTIVSRCKKIILQSSLEKKINNRYIVILNRLLKFKHVYEKFQLANEIIKNDKDEIDIVEMLNHWILFLKDDPNKKNIDTIIKIDRFIQLYKKNVNQRLFLENLFLEL